MTTAYHLATIHAGATVLRNDYEPDGSVVVEWRTAHGARHRLTVKPDGRKPGGLDIIETVLTVENAADFSLTIGRADDPNPADVSIAINTMKVEL